MLDIGYITRNANAKKKNHAIIYLIVSIFEGRLDS